MSPDGASFIDALVVAAGGGVAFPATPTAPTAAAGDGSGRLATTAYVDRAYASAPALGQAGVALGAVARRSGAFLLADARITPSSRLLVQLGPGPYPGKGTLADEARMYPGLTFAAAPGAGSALVQWAAPRGAAVRGSVTVTYLIG